MISFTSLLQAEPLVLEYVSDPETEYTKVEFLNAVITGMPDQVGFEDDNRGVPAPALMLKDGRGREISIIIRKDEARVFKDVLERHPERATIYELLVALLRKLDIQVIGTFVHDLTDYRFLAKLRLKMGRDGSGVEMTCRPSDAILLSLLSNSPIYVKNELMDEFSIDITEILGQR